VKTHPVAARRTAHAAPTAFTLVEVIVVVAIIALLISILLPALSGAQDAAKRATTTSLAGNLARAAEQFRADNGRAAGYFPETAMGDNANRTRGFTQMENILLDLAGGEADLIDTDDNGVPDQVPDPDSEDYLIEAGPYVMGDDLNIVVNTTSVGGSEGPGYLALDADTLRPIPGQASDFEEINTAGEIVAAMPDVIDAWGMPIVAWRRDPGAPITPSTMPDDYDYFALEEFNPATPRAGFYWNSNAGIFNAGDTSAADDDPASFGLGEERVRVYDLSLLGGGITNASPMLVQETMAAALGSPAYPADRPSDADPWRPARPRGDAVFMSAGADRGYLVPEALDQESANSVASLSDDPDKFISYVPTNAPIGGSGASTNIGDFDDIFVSAN